MSSHSYDVVVVGAGFAGLTAARELRHRGRSALVVEGRDRIGGRTWTDARWGCRLELGGTWVHWLQPHVWSELTRYDLEVEPSPSPQRVYWIAGGQVHQGSSHDFDTLIAPGMAALADEARWWFPHPYEPLARRGLTEIDRWSVADRLAQLGLSRDEHDALSGVWADHFSAPPRDGALTQALRWCAVASGDWRLLHEATSSYRLRDGTRQLAHAIAKDAGADMRLGSTVTAIEQEGNGASGGAGSGGGADARRAIVTTVDGTFVRAGRVVVTVPLNALSAIDMRPPLSPGKQAAAAEGTASRGVKAWIRVRGEIEPFTAYAPADHPLVWTRCEYVAEGDTILVALGPDAGQLRPDDTAEVAAALRRWRPDLDVVDVTGHDWVTDGFTHETWPMQRPDQLTSYLRDLQTPDGVVHLAGSDYASGWAGFIDGAIESGIRVARRCASP